MEATDRAEPDGRTRTPPPCADQTGSSILDVELAPHGTRSSRAGPTWNRFASCWVMRTRPPRACISTAPSSTCGRPFSIATQERRARNSRSHTSPTPPGHIPGCRRGVPHPVLWSRVPRLIIDIAASSVAHYGPVEALRPLPVGCPPDDETAEPPTGSAQPFLIRTWDYASATRVCGACGEPHESRKDERGADRGASRRARPDTDSAERNHNSRAISCNSSICELPT